MELVHRWVSWVSDTILSLPTRFRSKGKLFGIHEEKVTLNCIISVLSDRREGIISPELSFP